jgi:hypothetical protein
LAAKVAALGQGLGMGVDLADFAIIRRLGSQQAVADSHFCLTDYPQARGGQQFVDLGYSTFK